ncbi:MAG: cobalamin-binding protein [Ignavibacteria bacterium]|nr:cobalamin-binding protein [Ignavibacteria bacterium]
MNLEHKLSELAQFIISGKHLDAQKITTELVENNVDADTILKESLMKGMDVVGQRFRDNIIFVPQVLVSARAMKTAMKILEPLMIKGNIKSKGKILIGTVKGDVHDIGKNIVATMLQGGSYEVVDIGIGCDENKFLQEYEIHKPNVIGISALLTTTMVNMKPVIDHFKNKNINLPFIVGGAPINKKYADEIGAFGYGKDAYEAVKIVDSLLDS